MIVASRLAKNAWLGHGTVHSPACAGRAYGRVSGHDMAPKLWRAAGWEMRGTWELGNMNGANKLAKRAWLGHGIFHSPACAGRA